MVEKQNYKQTSQPISALQKVTINKEKFHHGVMIFFLSCKEKMVCGETQSKLGPSFQLGMYFHCYLQLPGANLGAKLEEVLQKTAVIFVENKNSLAVKK